MARPDLFIEAGAFDAAASARASLLVPTVIAFEANPENYRHFTAVHDFASRDVEYLNLALTHAPPVTFHLEVHEGSSVLGHSSLLGAGLVPVCRDIENPAAVRHPVREPRLPSGSGDRCDRCVHRPHPAAGEWPLLTGGRSHPMYGKASSALRGGLRLD